MKLFKYSLSLLVMLFFFSNCSDDEMPAPMVSACMQDLIDDFKANSTCAADLDEPSSVGDLIEKCLFKGEEVYIFSDGNCFPDGGSQVYSADNCESLCTLGGIAALTECDSVVFIENITNVELIWQN